MSATATEPKSGSKAPAKGRTTRQELSESHKAALAEGRREGRIVRDYLNALDESRPKRGRKVSPETIAERIEKIEAEVSAAPAYERLSLSQQLMDLREQQRQATEVVDLSALEAEFVKVAKSWADKKNYSYEAFRSVGVPVSVLKEAGLR